VGLRPLRLLPFFLVLLRSFTEVSVQEVFSEVRQESTIGGMRFSK
jgi:hypothetical protein